VSVTFRGLSSLDNVGFDYVALDDFDPPAVGTNYGDYWLNSSGSWSLKSFPGLPVAFAMQFNASSLPGPALLHLTYTNNQAVVWWSTNDVSGWYLQTNGNLATSSWGNYLGPVVNNRATNSAPQGNLFFRLKLH